MFITTVEPKTPLPERGAALVEMALVSFVVAIILVALIDFSIYLNERALLVENTSTVAREAVVQVGEQMQIVSINMSDPCPALIPIIQNVAHSFAERRSELLSDVNLASSCVVSNGRIVIGITGTKEPIDCLSCSVFGRFPGLNITSELMLEADQGP